MSCLLVHDFGPLALKFSTFYHFEMFVFQNKTKDYLCDKGQRV